MRLGDVKGEAFKHVHLASLSLPLTTAGAPGKSPGRETGRSESVETLVSCKVGCPSRPASLTNLASLSQAPRQQAGQRVKSELSGVRKNSKRRAWKTQSANNQGSLLSWLQPLSLPRASQGYRASPLSTSSVPGAKARVGRHQ